MINSPKGIPMIKTILFVITALFVSGTQAGSYMLMPIDSVYDGDTIKTHFSARRLPDELRFVSIRIRGIDTPELPAKSYATTGKLGRSKCDKEAKLALKAKKIVQELIANTGASRMKIENFKWGKFGSRIVADVKISGVDIATMLIEKSLAIPYNGGTKTHSWCA